MPRACASEPQLWKARADSSSVCCCACIWCVRQVSRLYVLPTVSKQKNKTCSIKYFNGGKCLAEHCANFPETNKILWGIWSADHAGINADADISWPSICRVLCCTEKRECPENCELQDWNCNRYRNLSALKGRKGAFRCWSTAVTAHHHWAKRSL